MKHILFFLILLSILFSQEKINLYWGNVKEDNYEMALLKKVINLIEQKENLKINLLTERLKSFDNIVTICKKIDQKNNTLFMAALSITEERKKWADFSSPYLFSYISIISHKTFINTDSNFYHSKNATMGYLKGTTSEILAKKMSIKYAIKLVEFNSTAEKNNIPANGLDFIFGDHFEIVNNPNLIVIKDFLDSKDNYGILYPKGSTLRNHLEKYLIYFLRSPENFNLLKTYFGENISEYYKGKL
jgi:hypothetical protein